MPLDYKDSYVALYCWNSILVRFVLYIFKVFDVLSCE